MFYVGFERTPGFISARNSLDLQKFMSRFLQFWCNFGPFCFLRDYYGGFLDVIFPQFPNHSLPFPMVFTFPLVFLRFPRVFLLFPPSASRVSYFRFCDLLIHNLFAYLFHDSRESFKVYCMLFITLLLIQGNLT